MTALEWWLYIVGFAYFLLIETGKDITRAERPLHKEFPGTLLCALCWPITGAVFVVAQVGKAARKVLS